MSEAAPWKTCRALSQFGRGTKTLQKAHLDPRRVGKVLVEVLDTISGGGVENVNHVVLLPCAQLKVWRVSKIPL